MMTYYEELGVGPLASSEEIRQGYKRLVRLVHPDQCGEEPVRQLADLQMKRLNGMLATLLNASSRHQYDLTLSTVAVPAAAPEAATPKWFSPLCGVTLLLATVFLFANLRRPADPPPLSPLPDAPEAPRRAPRPRPRRSGNPQASASDALAEALAEAPAASSAVRIAPPVHRETAGEPAPIRPVESVPSPAPPAAQPALAGDWLFVPASRTDNAGLYTPEYIEMRITENAGLVRGRYRARYRITDRAVSPNVAFQFEGNAAATEAKLPWHGTGGAKGEVSLRLLASGALEVTWAADQIGTELGLISGTATLVRKRD